MMQSYDLTIVGGGIVGLTLAASLADSALSIALIETSNRPILPEKPVNRVSAISFASKKIFEKLSVWQQLDSGRITAYDSMLVWDKDSFGKIEFSAQQVGYSELGYIIENDNLCLALLDTVQKQKNVSFYSPDSLNDIVFGEGEAWLTLHSGKTLTSKLVVGADGANSWLREKSTIPLTFWDYQHHALVATIKTELPHEHCARQIFTPDGPLAFLPLFEQNLCSIVWSVSPQKAEQLKNLTAVEFNKQLSRNFDNRLGLCELQSERFSFPLRMRYARDFAKHRIALIGDAAHTIHPLAGQGVNLGLLDAVSLGQTIEQNIAAEKDIGLYKNLRYFERWRKTEAAQMIASMELLKQLFEGDNPLQKALRDVALVFTDQVSPLKKSFIKQAMGLSGELPLLAK
ncbi:2-octaprenyl-3-methyl-6-methoxy-1,4-benzoquinol hydroxylase [Psychromonas ingrahamii 37]|uniref:2-octaprenyl-3-methyl-6-methoxy-1,4-benzoquinol hydroxylase n=1 Tax=Psychromonas ingrahamii (strain DSM 17664 / CCUG 51855 / 37) TaxID=357804 RepID=A1SSJ8_PSYIN|nr:2-octaprenyl-3-methyl-6-methoxy-1,4-benzoquinol hydroxylase [Psychromonas ingrahamii 37]